MTQIISPIEGEFMDPSNPEQYRPDTVGGGVESEVQNRFPDYDFEIPYEKIVKAPVVEMHTQDRVRTVLNVLDASEAPVDERIGSVNYRKRQFNAASNFMKKRFTYQGKDHTYHDLLDIEGTEKRLLESLAETNHPIFQVLSKVAEQYGEELGQREFGKIVHGVLTVTHWDTLKAEYEAQMETLRQQRTHN